MLENVDLYEIEVDYEYGAFLGSELQDFHKGIILTHFVLMSREKGEWVMETTFREFATNFAGKEFFQSSTELCQSVLDLENDGYLTIEMGKPDDILRVTEKFAELCRKEYA